MQYQTHIAECITISDYSFLLPRLFEVAQKVSGSSPSSKNATDTSSAS